MIVVAVSGCLGSGTGDMATRGSGSPATADGTIPAPPPALSAEMQDGSQSDIINGLLNRQSVLQSGSYVAVSDAVLAANSRAAEAELRAATLRAEARSTNWLPSIGPSISLTSLGTVIAGMFLEQALFDNGRRQAERDYAKADVEVAAVALAQDSNTRVLEALDLYVTAESAQARAAVNAAALGRMERFEYVMSERVKGGVSDRADLMVVSQKLNQMRAELAADQEATQGAMAELGAMSADPLAGVTGLSTLSQISPTATPLAVVKAEAEARRAVAGARAARAGYLPGLTASGTVTGQGADIGLQVAAPNGFGFGMGASLAAIEAEEAAATARTGQVQEDVNRELRGLESHLASLERQQAEARGIADQAAQNYDIFAAQLEAGQRAVPEVVGVFESKVRAERDAVSIGFEIARVEIKIAAIMGALVDGVRI